MEFVKALADPTRIKLLKLILQEELCVCELREILQISQPAVSQHIARLRNSGLVNERRSGMWTFYKADPEKVGTLLAELALFLEADPAEVPEMAEEVARRRAINRAEACPPNRGGKGS